MTHAYCSRRQSVSRLLHWRGGRGAAGRNCGLDAGGCRQSLQPAPVACHLVEPTCPMDQRQQLSEDSYQLVVSCQERCLVLIRLGRTSAATWLLAQRSLLNEGRNSLCLLDWGLSKHGTGRLTPDPREEIWRKRRRSLEGPTGVAPSGGGKAWYWGRRASQESGPFVNCGGCPQPVLVVLNRREEDGDARACAVDALHCSCRISRADASWTGWKAGWLCRRRTGLQAGACVAGDEGSAAAASVLRIKTGCLSASIDQQIRWKRGTAQVRESSRALLRQQEREAGVEGFESIRACPRKVLLFKALAAPSTQVLGAW